MEFDSLSFILLMLPAFILLMYFIQSNKIRNLIILLFSFYFYLMTDITGSFILFTVILITYLFSKLVEHNKKAYICYLIIVTAILTFFKYGNYILSSFETMNVNKIIMPVGISFFIFTSIAYISDIYYEKIEADNNFIHIFTFLTFFPTIVSGPILRYSSFSKYLKKKEITAQSIAIGFRRFTVGLAKKVIIANQLSTLVNAAFDIHCKLSTPLAWLSSIAFMLQLYYDFSGYSDMAIGIGTIIGFEIPENFNYPYSSHSIQEFWQRWHMSLGSWFKDYVYIPLGGNRVSKIRWMINTMIVWSLTGLWHGSTSNYFLWGIWNGILIILYKIFLKNKKIPGILSWLMTQFSVLIGFTIFRTINLSHLKLYLSALIGKAAPFSLLYIKQLDIVYLWLCLLLGILFAVPAVNKKIQTLLNKILFLYEIVILFLLFICVIFIICGSYSSFIYAGF